MKTETKVMNPQQQDNYSLKHIRRMKLFERQFLRSVVTALHTQIQPMVSVLRSKGIDAAINSLDALQINIHLSQPIIEIYKTVGLYFANKTIHDINQSIKEQKAGFGFNDEFLSEILKYFQKYLLNQVVLPISETTKQQILTIIQQGVKNGWGADRIAFALESSDLLLWRARLIVRTEANKAMNYGHRLGESKTEWESEKIWIDAKDFRERPSHRLIGGTRLAFTDRFLVPVYKGTKPPMQIGVDLMTGPGDNHAHAGNICNCRCTLAFRAKRDENGRLIRKPTSTMPASVEY